MSPQAKNKTVPTDAKVSAFIAAEPDARRRADCATLITLMSEVTGAPPVMWGTSIVGFGQYHYRYGSGREGDSMLIGFAPRKAALSIYAMGGVWSDPGRLAALGKCKAGGSCLYVKSLADLDLGELRAALTEGARRILALYPPGAVTTPALRAGADKARTAAKKATKAKQAATATPKRTSSARPSRTRATSRRKAR